ncbi:DNA polymerase IV [Kocuria rhizophila]|uniref:DNA polymerase IV n=1 Tax=Kocuria rhizophila (strain ATCC 9341 / DSM 348 / NBRC 103217 / DC2201) TaxID=378753 RepID=B2GJQ9_KOCRD|nr:DNA polymerase IV [Kocuria rhizophila]ASE10302.1 DNA polymerase IV [Kocuria rhizophila]BAG29840.1 DNA polymerase IV [Kocuria rhizophila DC2201]VEH74885.1 DNA polymerase IV [Kocuria rhizophila]
MGGPSPQQLSEYRRCAILHVDMDMFYVGVELLDAPQHRGRPVIVAGSGPRSVVLSASYEARRFGVHSAMPVSQARARCPSAVLLEPHREAYAHYSRIVMDIFRSVTDRVEQLSVDEAFVDVSGAIRRCGPPVEIARGLRRTIQQRTGLTASVGVAENKTVAKIASAHCKPDGLLVVAPEHTRAFLARLPVDRLWGVGRRTSETLRAAGLATVGDIAGTPLPRLHALVGVASGSHLQQLALGHDPRPVTPTREEKSLGAERTFQTDLSETAELKRVLLGLCHETAARLRRHGLRAGRVGLKLRYADFTTISRSRTLGHPVTSAHDLYTEAAGLLDALGRRPQAVRLVGIRAEKLVGADHALQLSLDGRDAEWGAAEEAMDRVHHRFGPGTVRPAKLVDPTVPNRPARDILDGT